MKKETSTLNDLEQELYEIINSVRNGHSLTGQGERVLQISEKIALVSIAKSLEKMTNITCELEKRNLTEKEKFDLEKEVENKKKEVTQTLNIEMKGIPKFIIKDQFYNTLQSEDGFLYVITETGELHHINQKLLDDDSFIIPSNSDTVIFRK